MRGIRNKLTLTYFLLIFLSLVLTGVSFLFLARAYLMQNLETRLINQGKVLAQLISMVNPEDQDLAVTFDFYLKKFKLEDGVNVRLISLKGDVLRNDGRKKGIVPVGKNKWQEGNDLHILVPLMFWQKKLGYLDVYKSFDEIDQIFRTMLVYFLAGMLISLGVVSFISFWVAKSLTDPIKEMHRVAWEIARGDFSQRIKANPQDELGELGQTINYMAGCLSSQIASLQQLEQSRSQFIGSISHELKTPLTIIKGFVMTLMDDEQMLDEWRPALEHINTETDRLSRLVKDLLELSKFRSKKVELNLEMCQLNTLVERAVTLFGDVARRKNCLLSLHTNNELPLVKIDEDRMMQVLINLVDNAIKFSSAGGTIRVETEKENNQIKVVVSDEGAGISEEELPFVFERFYRGKRAAVRGSGLGLAIVKEIITAHLGEIKVESEKDKGTTVTFKLKA